MNFDHEKRTALLSRLRRTLPMTAYARPALLSFLQAQGWGRRGTPRLSVTDAFDAGGSHGLMCRFLLSDETAPPSFVAPLSQLAFDRRHPPARELTAHCRRTARANAA